VLVLSAGLLEVAARCARKLATFGPGGASEPPARSPALLPALGDLVRSPYLSGICGYMLLFSFTSTLIYFEQAHIVSAQLPAVGPRTALFARIDLAVNLLTIVGQLAATSRLLRWLGVARTLVILPALTLAGFAALGAWPTLAAIVLVQVARRALDYAVARPTREVLFTVTTPEQKYKTKTVIDTVVYRGGDALGALASRWLPVAVGTYALPVCVGWALLSYWLGRRHEACAYASAPASQCDGSH
jgi:AAA family ATP:ADP antiporter